MKRLVTRGFSVLCALTLLFSFAACGTKTTGTRQSASLLPAKTESAVQSSSGAQSSNPAPANSSKAAQAAGSKTVANVNLPDLQYTGKAYVVLNGNKPQFSAGEITAKSFETYSPLDGKGRCGIAFACIGRDLMPTEKRGEIGSVRPTGWHTVKYDCVEGKYLYNRCHLIGYQLSGENANERNLITGTRYLNVNGMLPFENLVADYVKETDNHVMYRVTPVFVGDNLLASGVQIEGYSVEDNGGGVCFNVYCFNVQPGVDINYSNGESALSPNEAVQSKTEQTEQPAPAQSGGYVLNTNSKKVHTPGCDSLKNAKAENLQQYSGTLQSIIDEGYSPCKNCNPG